MSLDRLIDLAKKTGDRLIVHDPVHGRDVVIMDIEKYEELHLVGTRATKHLSDSELLDQINRDIALWRARQQDALDEELEEDEFLETDEDGLSGAFPESSPWHSTQQMFGDYGVSGKKSSTPNKQTALADDVFDGDERTKQEDEDVSEERIVTPLPYRNEGGVKWTEEPSLGGDEPVFYEEPV